MSEIKLGNLYEDKATGFTGIAVELRIHLVGAVQVVLQPTAIRGSEQGECVLPKSETFEAARVRMIND